MRAPARPEAGSLGDLGVRAGGGAAGRLQRGGEDLAERAGVSRAAQRARQLPLDGMLAHEVRRHGKGDLANESGCRSGCRRANPTAPEDRKSTRLNSSHVEISYAVFCLKKKKKYQKHHILRTKKTHKTYK